MTMTLKSQLWGRLTVFGFLTGMLVARSSAQTLLNPLTQPQFVNKLPIPAVIDARNGGSYSVPVRRATQWLGLVNPSTQAHLNTTIFGYNGTFPGPTILAKSNIPLNIEFPNELESLGIPIQHIIPIDTSIHWADPLGTGHGGGPYTGAIPIVTHLHGGHLESQSDGLPEAYYTPGYAQIGPNFNRVYYYDNSQPAATIWYHDHALGITRANVYAGMGGGYVITDEIEQKLQMLKVLPTGPYDIPLLITDRDFKSDGSLYFPSTSSVSGAPTPSIVPEFFGPFMLVNGMVWPFTEVEARPYRLRIVNTCDSRFLRLNFSNNMVVTQIGTDSGLMSTPFATNRLTLAPAERADIIVDFSNLGGQTINLLNIGKKPFPSGATPNPLTDGRVMQFRVINGAKRFAGPRIDPSTIRSYLGEYRPLKQNGPTRQLTLVNIPDEYGRNQATLGTFDGAKKWSDPTTEMVHLGDNEVWEIYNTTPTAHPVHLHLVRFQIVNRQSFTADADPLTGAITNMQLTSDPILPPGNELGWKDTALLPPGQVLRIIAHFDRVGEFVWHCHILSHEDHEMMRRFEVSP